MKVLTVLGTRPEMIRLSAVIPKLDSICDHVFVHTGQNFTANLADDFYEELGLRAPDYQLAVGRLPSVSAQVGAVISEVGDIILKERPDRLLILGDTNSCTAAYAAKRYGVKVFHMEAGNRCFDDRVPEEINRRMVDSLSDVLLPYTERARQNLLREGYAAQRVLVTGNPIAEILHALVPKLDIAATCAAFDVTPGSFVLVTMHRAENVDDSFRLAAYLEALASVGEALRLPVLLSVHPRLRSKLPALASPWLRAFDAFGFRDFVGLECAAALILTDSGTVQEEGAILGVPNIAIRFANERQETIEFGRSILVDPLRSDLAAIAQVLLKSGQPAQLPPEYTTLDVSDRVIRILMSDL